MYTPSGQETRRVRDANPLRTKILSKLTTRFLPTRMRCTVSSAFAVLASSNAAAERGERDSTTKDTKKHEKGRENERTLTADEPAFAVLASSNAAAERGKVQRTVTEQSVGC